MRSWATLLATAILLSGCSDGSSGGTADTDSAEDIDYGVEATATTGVIRGVVYDLAIRPLMNATVTITSLNETVVTKDDGAFGFDGLEPGTYFLDVVKRDYKSIQTSVEVVAGVDAPPILKVQMFGEPSAAPYVETFTYDAYITCGFAVIASSVGCDTFPDVGERLGDHVYFGLEFTTLPEWIQGELVWDTTQAAGGMAIWQLAGCDDTSDDPTGNNYCDGPPSQESPALTLVGGQKIIDNNESMMESGVQFNIFGGPHPACNVVFYGCGVTLQQKYQIFAHVFYNFSPEEGWRFYYDGPPVVPS